MYIRTRFPLRESHLVVVAGALAVLSERHKALVDEHGIVSMDVEAEQHQSTSNHTTYGVQQVQSLSYEIVQCLAVGLMPQVVLECKVLCIHVCSCIYMFIRLVALL